MTDTVILLAMVASAVWGFHQGVVRQLGSLAALLIALFACYLFGEVGVEIVEKLLGVDAESPLTRQIACEILGRGALFLIVWGAVNIFTRTIHQLVKIIHFGLINSLLGALFMVVKAGIVIGVAIMLWASVKPSSEVAQNPGPVTTAVCELSGGLLGALEGPDQAVESEE